MTRPPPDNQAPVLLVGGFGRVGRLVRALWPTDLPPPMVSRRNLPLSGAAFLWAPLDGPAALLDHLSRQGTLPPALVMLAGVTPAPGQDPALLHANATLAHACLTAARAAGIGRVLLASSAAVYGVHPDGLPFAEDSLPAPFSPYGRAKLQMEATAAPFRQAGLKVTALRIGNVAGADALLAPHQAAVMGHEVSPRNLMPLRIDGFADGLGPLRSYIGGQTLARVLARLAALPHPLPPVLNLASPEAVRMTALAQAAGLPYTLVPAPATAHQNITLDAGLLQGLVGFDPAESTAEDMLRQWHAAIARAGP